MVLQESWRGTCSRIEKGGNKEGNEDSEPLEQEMMGQGEGIWRAARVAAGRGGRGGRGDRGGRRG